MLVKGFNDEALKLNALTLEATNVSIKTLNASVVNAFEFIVILEGLRGLKRFLLWIIYNKRLQFEHTAENNLSIILIGKN